MVNILMVAAENDALPMVKIADKDITGKVGGIGDVVRHVPHALAERGCHVTVVTPAYGAFTNVPGCKHLNTLAVEFVGKTEHVDLYEVPDRDAVKSVRHLVLDHALFAACGRGRIYCDDPPQRPFATDATKFALFCTAVADGVTNDAFDAVDVIHLHDWHAAFLLILRRYHAAYRKLQGLRCVYTIHNLALQGVRPFTGDDSSLQSWFPRVRYDESLLADPRWSDCLNPAAVGIRLADAVHAVSPSYAQEIMQPSAVATRGYYGGEGLEGDLRNAHQQGRLFGILNGCPYPSAGAGAEHRWSELLALMRAQVLHWAGTEIHLASSHFLAHLRLARLTAKRPRMVLTSVGRISDQKLRLLRAPASDHRPALENLLQALGRDGIYLLLGSGDPNYEQFLTTTASRYDNFVFLRGYSDPLARALYGHGDLFLMPSSFEPCGISQMLSMRAGQPCMVHNVGGLRDTVQDGVTGFTFSGDSLTEQADNLIAAFRRALARYRDRSEEWQAMRKKVAGLRFSWAATAESYLTQLYQHPSNG